jgi:hypothetical protein
MIKACGKVARVALYNLRMIRFEARGASAAIMATALKILPTSSGSTHLVKRDLEEGDEKVSLECRVLSR